MLIYLLVSFKHFSGILSFALTLNSYFPISEFVATITIGDANVIDADITTIEGVLHVVDAVIFKR
jgi:hypothetical protein